MNKLKLKAKIIENGFSIKSFAKELNLSASTVYGWFNSDNNLSIKNVIRICELLKLTSDECTLIFFNK